MIYLKQKRLSRRRFLRGIGITGVAIGLPTLDIMSTHRGRFHGGAQAQDVAQPKRFLLYHFPNGVNEYGWRPPGVSDAGLGGTAWALSESLMPLARHRNKFDLVTGITNQAANAASTADGHENPVCVFASCVPCDVDSDPVLRVDQMSFDQILADRLRERRATTGESGVRFDSLYVAAQPNVNKRGRSRISWRGANDPIEPLTQPSVVFSQLFSSLEEPMAAMTAAARRQSILDYVKDDVADLQRSLGAEDRQRVEAHLEAIRAIERAAMGGVSASCRVPEGIPTDSAAAINAPASELSWENTSNHYIFAPRVELMQRMIAMAFQCDLTRVVVFSLGASATDFTYPAVPGGIDLGFDVPFAPTGLAIPDHAASHYDVGARGDPKEESGEAADNYRRIVRWKVDTFASMIDKLEAAPDGAGGSMLDHSAVVFASEFGKGDWHNCSDIAMLVAGKGGASSTTVATGRHVAYRCASDNGANISGCTGGSDSTELATFWRTILATMDVDPEFLGTSEILTDFWV